MTATRSGRVSPLVLLSLPNSGSTWVAGILARHIEACRYYRIEFFNPLRNRKHYSRLSTIFGCELAGCFRNIVHRPTPAQFAAVLRDTWRKEDYTFTKEVFCPRMLELFRGEGFQVRVLQSDETLVFPPTRVRVYSFYEHAYVALRERRHVGPPPDAPLLAKCLSAYRNLSVMLEHDARRAGLPILRYAELLTASPAAVSESLHRQQIPGLNVEAAARDIVSKRRMPAGRDPRKRSSATRVAAAWPRRTRCVSGI